MKEREIDLFYPFLRREFNTVCSSSSSSSSFAVSLGSFSYGSVLFCGGFSYFDFEIVEIPYLRRRGSEFFFWIPLVFLPEQESSLFLCDLDSLF